MHRSLGQAKELLQRAVNPAIRMGLEFYITVHPGDRLPQRRLLDPVALPPALLPHLFVIDVLPGGAGFRMRLMGTHQVGAYGRDFTGRRLVDAEIPGISRSATYAMLEPVARRGEPGYFRGPTAFRFQDDYETHEQVLLPFAGEGAEVAMICGVIHFEGHYEDYGPAAPRRSGSSAPDRGG